MYRRVKQDHNHYNLPDPNTNFLADLISKPLLSDSSYEGNDSGASSSRRGSRRPSSASHQSANQGNNSSSVSKSLFPQQSKPHRRPSRGSSGALGHKNSTSNLHNPSYNIPIQQINNAAAHAAEVSLSADEELELREFCETSSWETTSAPSEEDPSVNVRGAAFHNSHGHKPHSGGQNDSREDTGSDQSESSEKWPQERWEENECQKFQEKWHELQRDI